MNNKNAIRFLLASAVFSGAMLMSSCSKDDDPIQITVRLNQTPFEYDADGVWTGVATDKPVMSQYVVFSHTGEISPYGLLYSGFTPARCNDNQKYSNMLEHQFNVMSAGGVAGVGTPYLQAYWVSTETEETPLEDRSCRIYYAENPGAPHLPFIPQSVYVNNSCYTYYSMNDGDNFTSPFEEGDSLVLIAHGVASDGSEREVEFALADCKGENRDDWFVKDWTSFNLSDLGEVTDIYFTMRSTDVGQWGINTPTYFCLDLFTITAVLPD